MEVNFLTKRNIQPNIPLPISKQKEHRGEGMCVNRIVNNNRPTKNISFRGSAVLKAAEAIGDVASDAVSEIKIPNYARKLVKNPRFNWLIDQVLEKEAVVEAAIVLGLTTTIKPLCTLVMPGANKDDKEVLATKHALSGLVGYAFSKLIYSPVSKAANKISKNPTKYLKGDTEYIKKLKEGGKLQECFDVLWKKGPDVFMSIPKSMLTVALITPALAFLFPNHKKSQKNKLSKEQQKTSDLISKKISNDDKLTFKGRQQNKANISFTGSVPQEAAEAVQKSGIFSKAYDSLTEFLAKGISKISMLKPVKKVVLDLTKRKKPALLMSNLASIVLTLSLLNNTAKSKKIEKERKPYLLLNSALVTAISSTAATIIDFCSDGFLESMRKAYMSQKFGFNGDQIKKGLQQLGEIKEFGKVKDLACEVLSQERIDEITKYIRGVDKLKSHTIFSFVVRFASPLLVVPLTTKILDVISKRKKKKEEEAANAALISKNPQVAVQK